MGVHILNQIVTLGPLDSGQETRFFGKNLVSDISADEYLSSAGQFFGLSGGIDCRAGDDEFPLGSGAHTGDKHWPCMQADLHL